jgi:hypothetical protein
MASIQLTQVYLAPVLPNQNTPELFVVEGSESLIAINPATIAAVGPTYQVNGDIIDVRQVYITGMAIFYVTDSYATVKGYIDAL